MNQEEIEKYRQAGKIAKEAVKYARSIIKPGMLLLEIAEKIESKIIELGGKPGFPLSLCINDIAAHSTPASDDNIKASGLLKIDIGVHVDGYLADTAFSLDLEKNKENKKIIEAGEKALKQAGKILKPGIEVWKIGEEIHKTITSYNLAPVRNLSGHSLERYQIHAGLTIPNYNNNNEKKLEQGAYAIEPFATSGAGIVYEGKPSGIYRFEKRVGVRNQIARKILDYVEEEYKTLTFCERWLTKLFGTKTKLALKFLEQAGGIYQYPTLVEKSHKPVSQSEHSFLITDKVEIITG